MDKALVIGASGFVGRRLAVALLDSGLEVRALARKPDRVQDLAQRGCEVVKGDISDLASMERAMVSVQAAYICTHTLSPQQGSGRFMDVELDGLKNIVKACQAQGVRRLIYITFLGIAPDSKSEWVRERYKAEQYLIASGLDVTVLRPFQIVGVGGGGFNLMMGQARRRFTPVLGDGKKRVRNISVDDLIYYLIGVREEPRSYGRCFDVGCDDVLTTDEMIDVGAEVLCRRPPTKLHVPAGLLSALAPLIERITKLPRGAIRGMLDGAEDDAIGDPGPIRELLPRPPLSYRAAIEHALKTG